MKFILSGLGGRGAVGLGGEAITTSDHPAVRLKWSTYIAPKHRPDAISTHTPARRPSVMGDFRLRCQESPLECLSNWSYRLILLG